MTNVLPAFRNKRLPFPSSEPSMCLFGGSSTRQPAARSSPIPVWYVGIYDLARERRLVERLPFFHQSRVFGRGRLKGRTVALRALQ